MELELEEGSFIGMPFVLRSDGKWIKDSGSDFYVDFGDGFRQAQKVALYFLFSYCCYLHLILALTLNAIV